MSSPDAQPNIASSARFAVTIRPCASTDTMPCAAVSSSSRSSRSRSSSRRACSASSARRRSVTSNSSPVSRVTFPVRRVRRVPGSGSTTRRRRPARYDACSPTQPSSVRRVSSSWASTCGRSSSCTRDSHASKAGGSSGVKPYRARKPSSHSTRLVLASQRP